MRASYDWKNASPAFRNMFQLVNGLIAWTTITPLYYQGVIAGSEFLTYNAGKLYVFHHIDFSGGFAPNVGASFTTLYDMANAANHYISAFALVWDVTAAVVKYGSMSVERKDFWFSRVVSSNYLSIVFNGYRLNV